MGINAYMFIIKWFLLSNSKSSKTLPVASLCRRMLHSKSPACAIERLEMESNCFLSLYGSVYACLVALLFRVSSLSIVAFFVFRVASLPHSA